jgi:hypothetical protein
MRNSDRGAIASLGVVHEQAQNFPELSTNFQALGRPGLRGPAPSPVIPPDSSSVLPGFSVAFRAHAGYAQKREECVTRITRDREQLRYMGGAADPPTPAANVERSLTCTLSKVLHKRESSP